MKQQLTFIFKIVGLVTLILLCGFFFFDLFVLVGFNAGYITLEVAAIFLVSLTSLIVIYRRSNGFNSL